MVLDESMDIGTDHQSYSDVASTVNTNVTLFEFHHMRALGLGILAMLAIGGAYTADPQTKRLQGEEAPPAGHHIPREEAEACDRRIRLRR
jgi:hypothetical protein